MLGSTVLQGLKSVQGWFERVGALQACKAAARKVLQGRGLEALKGYLQKQPAPQSQHRDMQPCNSPPEVRLSCLNPEVRLHWCVD